MKVSENKKSFFVILCSHINGKDVFYDVMPRLRTELDNTKTDFAKYKRTKEYKRALNGEIAFNEYRMFPANIEELKKFIERKALYFWWSKCEYETLLSSWPTDSNKTKIDVYDQVKKNIDIITDILAKEYNIIK